MLAAGLAVPSAAAAQSHGVILGSAGTTPTVAVAGVGATLGPGVVLFMPYAEAGAGAHGLAVRGGLEFSVQVARMSERTSFYVGVGVGGTVTRQVERSGSDHVIDGGVLGLAGLRNRSGFFVQVAVGPPETFTHPVVVMSVGKIFWGR